MKEHHVSATLTLSPSLSLSDGLSYCLKFFPTRTNSKWKTKPTVVHLYSKSAKTSFSNSIVFFRRTPSLKTSVLKSSQHQASHVLMVKQLKSFFVFFWTATETVQELCDQIPWQRCEVSLKAFAKFLRVISLSSWNVLGKGALGFSSKPQLCHLLCQAHTHHLQTFLPSISVLWYTAAGQAREGAKWAHLFFQPSLRSKEWKGRIIPPLCGVCTELSAPTR